VKSQPPSAVPFPCDAQGSVFFAALASALLPALGYTEETPFYCGPKGSFCIQCGNCKTSALQKHQAQLYHDYETLTGVSFGWAWPEAEPDELVDFIMKHAGLTWRRLEKGMGGENVYQAVAASIDAGLPVLLKLGAGRDWHVATGRQNGALYVLGYGKKGRTLRNWYRSYEDAIIITGRCEPTITLADVLRRIIAVLEQPVHAALEAEIYRRIDEITTENAQTTAVWLNEKASFSVEARYHAAEAFTSGETAVNGLLRMTGNKVVKDLLGRIFFSYIADNHDETHGVLWQVWELLGVGPKTGYAVPKNANERMMLPETRAELKRLFALVFKNDRDVLAVLREALEAL